MLSNNSIFRRLRYTFDFRDSKMIEIFELAEGKVTVKQISNWLKKDSDPEYVEIEDVNLALFLNGLINLKRGKKEGEQPAPEQELNNNIVFRKLKIALNLKVEDIIDILKLVDFKVSKHEITAIFRNPKQRQYRHCQDQFLRNFLMGLQEKYRK